MYSYACVYMGFGRLLGVEIYGTRNSTPSMTQKVARWPCLLDAQHTVVSCPELCVRGVRRWRRACLKRTPRSPDSDPLDGFSFVSSCSHKLRVGYKGFCQSAVKVAGMLTGGPR